MKLSWRCSATGLSNCSSKKSPESLEPSPRSRRPRQELPRTLQPLRPEGDLPPDRPLLEELCLPLPMGEPDRCQCYAIQPKEKCVPDKPFWTSWIFQPKEKCLPSNHFWKSRPRRERSAARATDSPAPSDRRRNVSRATTSGSSSMNSWKNEIPHLQIDTAKTTQSIRKSTSMDSKYILDFGPNDMKIDDDSRSPHRQSLSSKLDPLRFYVLLNVLSIQ
ncbi:unnamed protein product [Caenorhabditis brenneri]